MHTALRVEKRANSYPILKQTQPRGMQFTRVAIPCTHDRQRLKVLALKQYAVALFVHVACSTRGAVSFSTSSKCMTSFLM